MLIDSPEEFAARKYDFVIIGGGTAGLTLAARLTEDPEVTVGVVEAGQNRLADPNILVPGLDFNAIGNPEYDWVFKTTPQRYMNGRVISQPRGKVLGGSSAINGMMCTYSSKEDIDSWEKLGNPGWSHDDLAPYYKKFANFTEPSKKTAQFYHIDDEVIDKELHDANGPIRTSFTNNKRIGGDAWVKTFNKLGLKMTADPQSGHGNGGYSNLITVDPASGTRSYAGTAYYQPNINRQNLVVLTEAQVNKITFNHHSGRIFANGLDFTSFGFNYHVTAQREILICAGSIQSPKILELSGIGSRNVLEPLGIKVVVENRNVGENFQDHGIVPLSYQAAEGVTTFDSFEIAGVESAATVQFYANQTGLLNSLIDSNANLSYQQVDQRTGHVSSTPIAKLTQAAVIDAVPILKKQYKLLGEALLNPKDSAYQMIYIPVGVQKGFANGEGSPSPGNFITFYVSVARPYSRGSVHITSKDPTAAPIIDPNYLSHPLDIELFSDGVLFLQYLATMEPFASLLKDGGKAFHPGFQHLTKETAGEFCREALTSEYHPLGTCSMMPEEEGGVVNPKLKVYGVANLRVVDASIFPLEIRNNLQTSVYAVAEKAADIIKSDWKESKGVKNVLKRESSLTEVRKSGKRARKS